jgi:hypothetical protein
VTCHPKALPPSAQSKQHFACSHTGRERTASERARAAGERTACKQPGDRLAILSYCHLVFSQAAFIGNIVIQFLLAILSSRKDWQYCHAKTFPCFILSAFCMAWQLLAILSNCHGNFSRTRLTQYILLHFLYNFYTYIYK